MPTQIRLCKVGPQDQLEQVDYRKLDLETPLEAWIERDISTPSTDLLGIDLQIETDSRGFVDLQCIDRNDDTVIVDLMSDLPLSNELNWSRLFSQCSQRAVGKNQAVQIGNHWESTFRA
jgi:hypothetical protein